MNDKTNFGGMKSIPDMIDTKFLNRLAIDYLSRRSIKTKTTSYFLNI